MAKFKLFIFMRTIRKISKNPFIVIFVALTTLFTSCSKDSFSKKEINLESISGEELFKSIVFADGKISSELSELKPLNKELKSLPSETLTNYRETQVEIINFIKEKDVNFFEEFKSDILSGNPQTISNSLKEAGNEVKLFTEKELLDKNIDLEKQLKQYSNDLDFADHEIINQGVGIWIVITVLVALIVAVNVNITSHINLDVMEPEVLMQHNMKYEQLVVDLIELAE